MSEVKQFHLREGTLVEGKSLGCLNVYLASDYDQLKAENDQQAARIAELQKDAYLRGLKDQKDTFENAYSSTDCWTMCENKTSDGLRAMDAAIDAAMGSKGE